MWKRIEVEFKSEMSRENQRSSYFPMKLTLKLIKPTSTRETARKKFITKITNSLSFHDRDTIEIKRCWWK